MSRTKIEPTNLIRRRYDRISFLYHLLEWPMEHMGASKERLLLREKISGPSVLEVGVGTGKNIPYYPADVSVTAIDFSPRMLARAEAKARRLNVKVDLREMDVQQLDLPSKSFDTIFATCVFCSVPDPVKGLAELKRVCKPDGQLLLLEHMRPGNFLPGLLFDLLNPLVVRITGANINRRTIENIESAGWKIQKSQNLFLDVLKWIEAVPQG
jgi:ubiquinone/menaquinone biosynthesis C-methylase UbiE